MYRQFGRPKEGVSIGPIKFSRVAELVNARAAMVGYAILMYIGYNTVSARPIHVLVSPFQYGAVASPSSMVLLLLHATEPLMTSVVHYHGSGSDMRHTLQCVLS